MNKKAAAIVIGMGEIGSAVSEILEESGLFKVHKKDMEPLEIGPENRIDVMHICIPYSDSFAEIVSSYISQYKPHITIINSTIKPNTTKEIFENTQADIVHSPVRGRHPKLKEGLLRFVKFIGPINAQSAEKAEEHFKKLGIKTRTLKSSVDSELGKLLSTTYYAINIAFHQEMDRICGIYGADFREAVTKFNQTCTMDIEHKIPRPIMFPGIIGGHCLLPNIEILKKDISSDFLDAIERSNENTKKKIDEGKEKYRVL